MPPERKSPLMAGTIAGGGRETGGELGSSTAKYSMSPSRRQDFSTQPSSKRMLAHALRYALAGYAVFPLQPNAKAPAIPSVHPAGDPLHGVCRGECGKEGHGVYDATTDVETIGEWWARWPAANIGLAIGDAHVVLDVDPRHGGALAALTRLGLDPTRTATQRTRAGGWHVVYMKPPSMAFETHLADLPGIDVLSGGRYIVASPSVVEGKSYRWERDLLDVEPERLPLAVAERLQKRIAPPLPARPAASNGTPAPGAPALHVIEHALAHLDPWRGDYAWWLSILMALHSAYPNADGLDLAERWGKGTPGEIAKKWASFDTAGGITINRLLVEAKAAGWLPTLASTDQPTKETAHEVLHAKLDAHGGDCPICGKSFFETAVVGDTVRGRRRIMLCHRRDCATWLAYKVERQILQAEPWTWAGWFVSEHDEQTHRRLVNGELAKRTDWLGAPTVHETICLFTAWHRPGCTSISLATMLAMAAERLLSIPFGKRLRRSKPAARAKRAAVIDAETSTEPTAPAVQEKPAFRRWAFGLDMLDERSAWSVLAIIEAHGGVVTPKGDFRYHVSLDEKIRTAVAQWMAPERSERGIDAYSPRVSGHALISPAPTLPEQEGYRRMPEKQRKDARFYLLCDVERDYRTREVLQSGR